MKIITLLSATLLSASAFAHEYTDAMTEHYNQTVKDWVNKPLLLDAIKAQNIKHAGLTEAQIIELDNEWRDGVSAGGNDLINGLLTNELSMYLKDVEMSGAGLYTEIFVMDNKGLNVGQSSTTSDYWQGDEGKFKKSYGMGAGSVFIDEIEEDESTQTFQSQLNAAITDESGNVIGAITIGMNVDEL